MTREASAAMRALVEAFDAATCAEHEMVVMHNRCNEDWRQESVEESYAARTALLAAIAAQEAATEAAQAEVARLRKAITYIADACVVAMRLSDAIGLDAGAMPEIERDLRAALKETP